MSWEDHPDRPEDHTLVCELSDIPELGGLEVAFGEGKENFKLLLLRKGRNVWSYLNSCPHFSLPLNYLPQKFNFSDGRLVCAHHTAIFEVETGACVDGPCNGSALTKVPCYMDEDGKIWFGSTDQPS